MIGAFLLPRKLVIKQSTVLALQIFFWHVSPKSVITYALYLVNDLYFYPISMVWSGFWKGFLMATKGGQTEAYIPKTVQSNYYFSVTDI